MHAEHRANLQPDSRSIPTARPPAVDVIARRLKIEEAINVWILMAFTSDWAIPGYLPVVSKINHMMILLFWLVCTFAFLSNRCRIHWELWTVRFASAYLFWTLLSLTWGAAPLSTSYSPALTSIAVFMYFNYVLDRFTVAEFTRLLTWALTIVLTMSIIAVVFAPAIGISSGSSDPNPANAGSWKGVFFQKNRLGLVCVLGIATCLGLKPKTSIDRVWKWSLLVLTLVLTIGSRSRETWIAGIILFMLAFFLRFLQNYEPNSRLPLILAMGSFIVLFAILGYENLDAILALFGRNRTLTGRSEIWESSMMIISRRPWLGYGTYGFWRTPQAWDIVVRVGWQVTSAHNAYLETCIDYGIIGLLIFLPIPISSFIYTVRGIMNYSLKEFEIFIYMLTGILIVSFSGSAITWWNGISFIALLFAVSNLEKVERSGFMSLRSTEA